MLVAHVEGGSGHGQAKDAHVAPHSIHLQVGSSLLRVKIVLPVVRAYLVIAQGESEASIEREQPAGAGECGAVLPAQLREVIRPAQEEAGVAEIREKSLEEEISVPRIAVGLEREKGQLLGDDKAGAATKEVGDEVIIAEGGNAFIHYDCFSLGACKA